MPAFRRLRCWSLFTVEEFPSLVFVKLPRALTSVGANAICLNSLELLQHYFDRDARVRMFCDRNGLTERIFAWSAEKLAAWWDPWKLDILIPENHPKRKEVFPLGGTMGLSAL